MRRVVLVLALIVSACARDVAAPRPPVEPEPDDPAPPGTPGTPGTPWPAGLVLSSPIIAGAPDASVSVVYVSAASGTRSSAVAASVLSKGSGARAVATIVDGGFDPVVVTAGDGDTINVSLLDGQGGASNYVGAVRRPVSPRVVRTSPLAGRRDVPLNSIVLVVFSAPMDSTAVSGRLQLTVAGEVVPGTVRLRTDRLAAEFVPTAALAPETDYELRVDPAIRDVLGAPLTGEVRIAFRTIARQDSTTSPPPDTTSTTPSAELRITIYPARHSEPLWDDPAGGEHWRPRALFAGDTLWLRLADWYPVPIGSLSGEWQTNDPTTMSIEAAADGREAIAVALAPGTAEVQATVNGAVGKFRVQVFERMPASMLTGVRIDIARDGDFVFRQGLDGTSAVRLGDERSLGQGSTMWSQYMWGFPMYPAWRLASAHTDGRLATNRGGLSITDVMGGPARVLAGPPQLPSSVFCPAWSPDGRYLAVTAYEEWDELYVVDTQTGEVRFLMFGRFATCPIWHPDGTRLFVTVPDAQYPPCCWRWGLVVLSVALDRQGAGAPLFWEMVAGPFHPDGQSLLAVDLYGDMLRITPGGQQLARIAAVARVSPVAWSPDGSQIAMPYYVMSADGRYAMNVEGEILGFAP